MSTSIFRSLVSFLAGLIAPKKDREDSSVRIEFAGIRYVERDMTPEEERAYQTSEQERKAMRAQYNPSIFDQHIKDNPECGMRRLWECRHKFHRPKTKTVADCEKEKRADWPHAILNHFKNFQKQLADSDWEAFTIHAGSMCDCPHIPANKLGQKLRRQEVVETIKRLPALCLWNLDIRPGI
jgi:hypothetical protein